MGVTRPKTVQRTQTQKSSRRSPVKQVARNKKTYAKSGKDGAISSIQLADLMRRGRDRGFVTESEILHYFRTPRKTWKLWRNCIASWRSRISGSLNRGVFRAGNCGKTSGKGEKAEGRPKRFEAEDHLSHDSVQMYLREIGRVPLLKASRR